VAYYALLRGASGDSAVAGVSPVANGYYHRSAPGCVHGFASATGAP